MKTVIFDLNGTLFDTKLLDRLFDKACEENLRPVWLAKSLHRTLVLNETNDYKPFSEIVQAEFEALVETEDHNAEFKRLMAELPAFPDVPDAIKKFKEEGFKLFALTQSSRAEGESLLRQSDLLHFFERVISTDDVRKFKPAQDPYRLAEQIVAEPAWYVAAHAWDTTGAKKAGFKTALLEREEAGFTKLDAAPDVKSEVFTSLVQQIVDFNNPLKRSIDKVVDTMKARKKHQMEKTSENQS